MTSRRDDEEDANRFGRRNLLFGIGVTAAVAPAPEGPRAVVGEFAGVESLIPMADGRARIKKGAPLLLEIGQRDMEGNKVCVMRRDQMQAGKRFIPRDEFIKTVADELVDLVDGPGETVGHQSPEPCRDDDGGCTHR